MKPVKDLFEQVAQIQERQKKNPPKPQPLTKVVQIPLWSDELRGMPNVLVRSALFAPIARGKRKVHDRTQIASRGDAEILYTGKQLDIADEDVFMQALEIAKGQPLTKYIRVNRAEFLRAIGRKDGKSDYLWLDEAMHRLKTGTLTIRTKRYVAELSLIDYWFRDSDTGVFELGVSPKLLALFANNEYSLIDWEKRLAITRRVDLAKWMQTYIASHEKGEQRISIQNIKEWCGQGNRRMDHFRDALQEALEELARIGVINKPEIREDGMVIYRRL